jgi:glutathione S-transferase
MKLHYSATSPYVRKVVVTLHETNQLADVEFLNAAGNPVNPGTMPVAQNPLGKVPTLERDEGPALYDSRVICRFLVDRAKSNLYGESDGLWETLTLEATADGILDAAILMVYEGRVRPEEFQYSAWVEGQWSKVTRSLDALNDSWISHLSGPLNMGQIATGCALGYLDFRFGARDWRQNRDGLATWYAKFGERDSMVATAPAD